MTYCRSVSEGNKIHTYNKQTKNNQKMMGFNLSNARLNDNRKTSDEV